MIITGGPGVQLLKFSVILNLPRTIPAQQNKYIAKCTSGIGLDYLSQLLSASDYQIVEENFTKT